MQTAKTDQTANAQADLILCWAHMSFCWFCHAAALIQPNWKTEHLSFNNSKSVGVNTRKEMTKQSQKLAEV